MTSYLFNPGMIISHVAELSYLEHAARSNIRLLTNQPRTSSWDLGWHSTLTVQYNPVSAKNFDGIGPTKCSSFMLTWLAVDLVLRDVFRVLHPLQAGQTMTSYIYAFQLRLCTCMISQISQALLAVSTRVASPKHTFYKNLDCQTNVRFETDVTMIS